MSLHFLFLIIVCQAAQMQKEDFTKGQQMYEMYDISQAPKHIEEPENELLTIEKENAPKEKVENQVLSEGQQVYYYSDTYKNYLVAYVEKVNKDGTVNLDVKGHVKLEKISSVKPKGYKMSNHRILLNYQKMLSMKQELLEEGMPEDLVRAAYEHENRQSELQFLAKNKDHIADICKVFAHLKKGIISLDLLKSIKKDMMHFFVRQALNLASVNNFRPLAGLILVKVIVEGKVWKKMWKRNLWQGLLRFSWRKWIQVDLLHYSDTDETTKDILTSLLEKTTKISRNAKNPTLTANSIASGLSKFFEDVNSGDSDELFDSMIVHYDE